MNKFEIETDPHDPTMIAVTFWSSPNSGMTFRMAPSDLQELSTVITDYQGAQQ